MVGDQRRAKQTLRRAIRQARGGMSERARELADAGITRGLVRLVESSGARTVAAYLSTPQEPSTRGFLAWARAAGVRVLLPVSRPDALLDWSVDAGGPEEVDALGMPRPQGEPSPGILAEAELMLVPAAAVDRGGMRMGWGRGSFDRTLDAMARRPPVYAVVFDPELLDTVPVEGHDVPVDGAITPSRTVAFGPRPTAEHVDRRAH